MKLRFFIFAIAALLTSCKTQPEHNNQGKITIEFYDPGFTLDSLSDLRTDGYYEIKSISGTYTTDLIVYKRMPPTYGFIQFYKDGFCRIGPWNGLYESPEAIRQKVMLNNTYVHWGIYKISSDSLAIEFLDGRCNESRNTINAIINDEKIIITNLGIRKYSYTENKSDSLTSSCIGKFVQAELHYDEKDNYLKNNIENYLSDSSEAQ
ncbi:hypothetical protein E0W68_01450 [Flavobacterium salilacus subsp. salilacus]|uniref:hypothetical protein n=1 Tax=Flavobacterium TaxID=237 RepID=UPI00107514E3|nr:MULTISPECIES: hypothetical protein [Flavobacterium]KAF2519919.1 hypothetical protein E0W68_01450 [Flavobacterium salilacus subsp. salilacus]MBE1614170.1 hypothetical protein [Flavobacterium sp. SaA2.13]